MPRDDVRDAAADSPKHELSARVVGYRPADLADWTGSADPGEVNDALDQLGSRLKDAETALGLPGAGMLVLASRMFDVRPPPPGPDFATLMLAAQFFGP